MAATAHMTDRPHEQTTRSDGALPDSGASRRRWFGEQVDGVLPRLMATALRLTKNATEAEDLVADALVKAWNGLETLKRPDALGAWLCRIVTNTFISQRRYGLSPSEFEAYDEEGASDPHGESSFSIFERLHQPFLLWQTNPEREFLNRLLREDLEEAIDGLPDVYRGVVVLVDVQGLSYEDTAESLDVPIGTVRSRLARGRSLLQEALWSQAVDEGYRHAGQQDTDSYKGSEND